MTNIHTIETGAKVSGSYCGVAYRGIVTSQRGHTMNHNITLFDVQLESPITVFGLERNSLHVSASDDAAALVRYLGGVDMGDSIAHAAGVAR